ncbi:hypothetical protein [Pelistega suis]|uniref:DUF945 domain-containing protein n=1 Tax=Pelistega suis TaxID=1631957 RepID=A0A849P9I4_9BURK|nr:hypothetical protein [Pelistega suis]NOL51597.1 hypothetical protein [Pelistega suis]
MSKTKLLVGAVAVAVAGLAWHFAGNKDATSPVGSMAEQQLNPQEAKSAALVKNFEAYLAGTEQTGAYKWERISTLDDGTARLHNVSYQAPNMTEQEVIKFKHFDLQKMTYTSELYEQKVSFEGLSNAEGKSLVQEALYQDDVYKSLGYTGDLPLSNGEFDLMHDVKNNKAAMSILFKQADFLNIQVNFAGTQLNDFLDVITKTSDKELEENPMKLVGALSPALIEKLSIQANDTGLIERTQKLSDATPLTMDTCQFSLAMMGISLDDSACTNFTHFVNGQQKQLKISINPAQAVAVGKMMLDLASPTPETIAAIVKDLNLKVEN